MAVACYETAYKNYGNCVCMDNGRIKLIATVDEGPRIIFFGFCDGPNVLFEDYERNFYEINPGYGVWYAYGGHRIWCAPEKMPETYLPDNSKVDISFDGNVLTLTPPRTIFDKQYSLVCTMNDDDSVIIQNRITNCSDKAMEFAPWSVTGLAPGGTEFIPLCRDNNGFLPNRTMSLWSYADIYDTRFTLANKYALLRQNPEEKTAFKVGFNVTDGYIAYILGSQMLKVSVEEYHRIEYPDFCCNFETYTNELFLECEILGELRNYEPGETASITEKWELSHVKGSTDDVVEELISERK